MSKSIYRKQLNIVLNCLDILGELDKFGLKGGTAINLFTLDMPRFSVDIDLTYLPIEDRTKTIKGIQDELFRYKELIERTRPGYKVSFVYNKKKDIVLKLNVIHDGVLIKIEPNFIVRGTLWPVERKSLCQSAQEEFQVFVGNIPVVAMAELYAGKLCAALSRQHPRDLFDVKVLYDQGGIAPKIRQAFVIYLASSPKPIHEMLVPNHLDVSVAFNNEFLGMVSTDISYNELIAVREKLFKDIRSSLTDNERAFLISIKKGIPEWGLMPFAHLDQLPALKWKLINIKKMDKKKHATMLVELQRALE